MRVIDLFDRLKRTEGFGFPVEGELLRPLATTLHGDIVLSFTQRRGAHGSLQCTELWAWQERTLGLPKGNDSAPDLSRWYVRPETRKLMKRGQKFAVDTN